jgi:hypothetical protein
LLNNASSKAKKIFQIACPLFVVEKTVEEPVLFNENTSKLTEEIRRQLAKSGGKSSVKKKEEEEEKSEYSVSDNEELDDEDKLVSCVQFSGLMGLNFSNYKGFLGSLSILIFTKKSAI